MERLFEHAPHDGFRVLILHQFFAYGTQLHILIRHNPFLIFFTSITYNKKQKPGKLLTNYNLKNLFLYKLLQPIDFSYIQTPFRYHKYQNDVYLH